MRKKPAHAWITPLETEELSFEESQTILRGEFEEEEMNEWKHVHLTRVTYATIEDVSEVVNSLANAEFYTFVSLNKHAMLIPSEDMPILGCENEQTISVKQSEKG